jgi:hypothetical protein
MLSYVARFNLFLMLAAPLGLEWCKRVFITILMTISSYKKYIAPLTILLISAANF